MLLNCRNTLALLNRANVQKGISFLWTEEGNSFSRVSECFVGCGFSTGSIAGQLFSDQKGAGEFLSHAAYRKSSRCCHPFTFTVLFYLWLLLTGHSLYLWQQLVFIRQIGIKIQPLMKMYK